MALKRLVKEYEGLLAHGPEGILAGPVSEDNFFAWEAIIAGPPETPYEGGLYIALLNFPKDYPLSPPSMKFVSEIPHPNVYKDGRVCISILHPPGADPTGYELSSERWSPVLSVEKILLSVVSMLSAPNPESSANLDVSIMMRDNPSQFQRLSRDSVKKSLGF